MHRLIVNPLEMRLFVLSLTAAVVLGTLVSGRGLGFAPSAPRLLFLGAVGIGLDRAIANGWIDAVGTTVPSWGEVTARCAEHCVLLTVLLALGTGLVVELACGRMRDALRWLVAAVVAPLALVTLAAVTVAVWTFAAFACHQTCSHPAPLAICCRAERAVKSAGGVFRHSWPQALVLIPLGLAAVPPRSRVGGRPDACEPVAQP